MVLHVHVLCMMKTEAAWHEDSNILLQNKDMFADIMQCDVHIKIMLVHGLIAMM